MMCVATQEWVYHGRMHRRIYKLIYHLQSSDMFRVRFYPLFPISSKYPTQHGRSRAFEHMEMLG